MKKSCLSFIERRLRLLPGVASVQRVSEKKVSLRAITWNDPLYNKMWYWHENSLMNVYRAWTEYNASGSGTTIVVIDDGLELGHAEFSHNQNSQLSFDYLRNRDQPTPTFGQSHGTKVAGVAAAGRNNGHCGFGIAPEASIAGVRIITSGQRVSELREVSFYVNTPYWNKHTL